MPDGALLAPPPVTPENPHVRLTEWQHVTLLIALAVAGTFVGDELRPEHPPAARGQRGAARRGSRPGRLVRPPRSC